MWIRDGGRKKGRVFLGFGIMVIYNAGTIYVDDLGVDCKSCVREKKV